MHRLLLILGLLGLICHPAALGAAERNPLPAVAEVDAEGKVLAQPDQATLILAVDTQAPQAQAAAEENARRADALLKALAQLLKAEEKVQSLSYRLSPVRTYNDTRKKWEMAGYKAENRFQVKLRELKRLGAVIDTALKSGANEVSGPTWGHSRLEELRLQAYAEAMQKARRLAEALARAEGLKVKRLQEVYTSRQVPIPRRGGAMMEKALAAAPATPVEVGEEEIRVHIWAVFELSEK